jgi:hypothetical protein
MIPKIIHYCWFGRNPKSKDVLKCIASWKKYLPDYEIKEWNEDNYDVTKSQYMADAYKEKKWAFVSDYCRIDVVYQYGGIYLDTDVEVIRSFNPLLKEKMFCGFESRDLKQQRIWKMDLEQSVAFGLGFGAEQCHPVLKQMLELYEMLHFYNDDGTLNLLSCPVYQTQILVKNGLKQDGKTQTFIGGKAFSAEYFCPQSNLTEDMLFLTEKTYSVHHFSNSWTDSPVKNKLRKALASFLPFNIADKIASILSFPFK